MVTSLMQARSVVDVGCYRRATLLPTSTDVADLLKEQVVDACRRGGFGAGATVGAAAGGQQRADGKWTGQWADGRRMTSTQADDVDAGEASSGRLRGRDGWPGSFDPGACRCRRRSRWLRRESTTGWVLERKCLGLPCCRSVDELSPLDCVLKIGIK
ncbi:hypothetical protein ACLOJK_012314 [Asimina triloba]